MPAPSRTPKAVVAPDFAVQAPPVALALPQPPVSVRLKVSAATVLAIGSSPLVTGSTWTKSHVAGKGGAGPAEAEIGGLLLETLLREGHVRYRMLVARAGQGNGPRR